MNPVCDQGLRVHPGGVELVAGIRAPEPDQNQPVGWKRKHEFIMLRGKQKCRPLLGAKIQSSLAAIRPPFFLSTVYRPDILEVRLVGGRGAGRDEGRGQVYFYVVPSET